METCMYCEREILSTDYTVTVTIRGAEHEMHDACVSFMDEDERDYAAEMRNDLRKEQEDW